MPSPATAVPTNSAAIPGRRRSRMPATSVSARPATAASLPIRRARRGATGAPAAMQMTGSVVSAPAAVVESGTSARSSSSSGGTLATAVRRLSAVKTIAAAVSVRWRGYALSKSSELLEEKQMATVELEQQRLLIGGEWVPASSGRSWQSSGPVAGVGASTVAAAGPEDARRAADAAAAAFPSWAATPPGERRALLGRAADLLEERAQAIAGVVTEETGGTFGWGMFNCSLAAGMLREAAAQAYGLIGEVIPSDVPGLLAMGVRQPAGVVCGIAPWNAPVILGTRAVATPLAYGNTVVLKASEECPRTHAAIASVLEDAGMPPGVVNLIVNEPADAAEVVEALIAHPAVRRINFTGSTRVGRIIAEKAGAHLKRVLLELGGKAPLVVLG